MAIVSIRTQMGKWQSACNWSDRVPWCIHLERSSLIYQGMKYRYLSADASIILNCKISAASVHVGIISICHVLLVVI